MQTEINTKEKFNKVEQYLFNEMSIREKRTLNQNWSNVSEVKKIRFNMK